MKLNPLTDEKLQIKILKFIDSFPCESLLEEPTWITIYNHFVRDKKIDSKKFEHNFNKLRGRCIRPLSGSQYRGNIFFLTPEGESVINSKSKIFKNKNIINKTTIKKISIIGNHNIANQGNNSTISTNRIFLKELKKIINKSNLTREQKNTWFDNFKNYCSNPMLLIEIAKLILPKNLNT